MSRGARAGSGPTERTVVVGGERCRVLEQGAGRPLCFLGGLFGLPRWPVFLERLAEQRRVVAPSLPGLPGARGHERLDDVADWVTATLDLLDASGLGSEPVDLVGASLGAALAAEVAAFSRANVARLVLISPLGLYDPAEPTADLFAQRASELPALLAARPDELEAFLAPPADADPVEWQIVQTRAREAAARYLWPLGDRGLARRLHRVRAPTLLLFGGRDRVLPGSYAKRLAAGIGGWVEIKSIEDAGHLLEIDEPDAAAGAVLRFLG